MDNIRIDHGAVRMVAHRGLSALERENTCAAFVAAGVRSYFGIETDVHVTADGKYLICHDSNLKRVSGGVELNIEANKFDLLQSVPLLDTDGVSYRSDLFPPALEDYVLICHKYEKESVLELKGLIEEKHIAGIVATVRDFGHLDRTTFISFTPENLIAVRKVCPEAKMQFLSGEFKPETLDFMKLYRAGADFAWKCVTKDVVDAVHAAGLEFNVWTVDKPELAAQMIDCGVDYITSNILE
jgi:glycerophosphoryl diester phosphodiesterase